MLFYGSYTCFIEYYTSNVTMRHVITHIFSCLLITSRTLFIKETFVEHFYLFIYKFFFSKNHLQILKAHT